MMGFSTRCCRRASSLAALATVVLALLAPAVSIADRIEVRQAALRIEEEGAFLEADFDIALNPTLEGALSKGVPLYFLLEFEVIRPRWYWVNERVLANQQHYRLSYNALTRQYRIGVGGLYQNFATLAEALDFMSRVRRREDIDPAILRKDTSYSAAVRMRLDTTQLPRPFQLNTLGSRDWNLASEWHRWTISP
jgi:hypothetical protein